MVNHRFRSKRLTRTNANRTTGPVVLHYDMHSIALFWEIIIIRISRLQSYACNQCVAYEF